MAKITRALISVSDKTGIVEFSKELARSKVEILSTGGPAKLLRDAGRMLWMFPSSPVFPRCSTVGSRPCTQRCTAAFWGCGAIRPMWRR